MNRSIDITGQRSGKLVAIYPTRDESGKLVWCCQCDCGGNKLFEANRISSGRATSCGCKRKEGTATTHGMSKTPEYRHWVAMKARCLNKNCKDYPNYGGSGVMVQKSWVDNFMEFYEHIGPKPTEGEYTVDRIDPTKGYEEGNVQWLLKKFQARNKTRYKRNTTGVTGVSRRICPEEPHRSFRVYWIARWTDLQGKSHAKHFSVSQYGEELAEFLAIEFRDKKMWELNKLVTCSTHPTTENRGG